MTEQSARPYPLLIGHGSRHADTVHAGEEFAQQVSTSLGQTVGLAWLDYCRPSIGDMLEKLQADGIPELAIQPLMLTGASHVQEDIPNALKGFDGTVHMGAPLGTQTLYSDLVLPFAEKAATEFKQPPQILLIARDSDGNQFKQDAEKVAATLTATLGVQPKIGYVGKTDTPWEMVLETMPDQDLLVLPLLLMRGRLSDKIAAKVNNRSAQTITMPPLTQNKMMALNVAAELRRLQDTA